MLGSFCYSTICWPTPSSSSVLLSYEPQKSFPCCPVPKQTNPHQAVTRELFPIGRFSVWLHMSFDICSVEQLLKYLEDCLHLQHMWAELQSGVLLRGILGVFEAVRVSYLTLGLAIGSCVGMRILTFL